MLGYSREELLKINLFQLDPFYLKEKYQQDWDGFVKEQKPHGIQIESFHKKKDGSLLPVEIISNHVWVGDKDLHVAYSRDISERKKAEEELREKDALFKTLFHNLTSASSIYKVITDNKGKPVDYRFVTVNSAYKKLTGLDEDQVIGKTILEVFPHTEKVWLEALEKVYLTGTPIHLEDYAQEIGKYLELVIYRTAEDMVSLIGTDVTDRKQNEENLRLFKISIDNSNDAVYWLDKDANFEYVNEVACKNLGYSEEELLNLSIFDVDPILTKEEWYNIYESFQIKRNEGNIVNRIETVHQKRDGTIYPVEVTSNHFWIENKEFHIAQIRDITKRKEDEENLKNLANLNQTIIDGVSSGLIFIKDRKVEWVNNVLLVMFGYDFEELLGQSAAIFYGDKKMYDVVGKEAYLKISKGETYVTELAGRKKNSSLFWCLLTSKATDPNDLSKGTLWTVTDIDKRKQDEENLRMFKTSIEHSMEAVYWMDRKGKIIYINEQAINMLGYTKDELLSLCVFDIDPVFSKDKWDENWEDHLSSGETKGEEIETFHKRKDGSVFPVNIITHYLLEGDTFLQMAHVRDVTERKESEKQIIKAKEKAEESEYFLRESQRAGKTGSYKMDVKTGTWISTETLDQIFGIDASYEKNVKGWSDLIHPDDVELINEYLLNEVLGKKHPFNNEYRIIRKNDKATRWVHGVGKLNIDQDGNIVSMVGTIQDITEYKEAVIELTEAKDKAEESDKLKTSFLANLSHEIRTPMNGILGFAGLLKRKNLSPDAISRYINIIEKSGERMLKLINDLVDISKIEANQITNEPQETKLNNLIDDIYGFFKPQISQKGISLTCKKGLEDPNLSIFIDKLKLEQVLSNLMDNALKFTKEGSIELKYEIIENELIFSVKDTGVGIPSGMENTIFERFRQAEHTYLKETEGSGLGLSISEAFVKCMGGKIWVESTYGKGTEFLFSLPFHPSKKMERIIASPVKDSLDKELTILLAEDDEVSLLYFKELFLSNNVKLIHAKNGEQAIKMFNENPEVKIILMDLKMPVMNGIDATIAIRKKNSQIPIIVQTAYASELDRQKAMKAGCTDFVTKPIQKELLLEKMEKALVSE